MPKNEKKSLEIEGGVGLDLTGRHWSGRPAGEERERERERAMGNFHIIFFFWKNYNLAPKLLPYLDLDGPLNYQDLHFDPSNYHNL